MRDLSDKQLVFLSFYYFWLIFLTACVGFDLYMDTVTGFTFGYAGAFIYFTLRMRDVRQELEKMKDE